MLQALFELIERSATLSLLVLSSSKYRSAETKVCLGERCGTLSIEVPNHGQMVDYLDFHVEVTLVLFSELSKECKSDWQEA